MDPACHLEEGISFFSSNQFLPFPHLISCVLHFHPPLSLPSSLNAFDSSLLYFPAVLLALTLLLLLLLLF